MIIVIKCKKLDSFTLTDLLKHLICMFLLYPFCISTDTTDTQENGLRNMQCKIKKNFIYTRVL